MTAQNNLSNWILVVYALFSLIFPANLRDFSENHTDLQELVIFLQICAKAKTFLQIYGNLANLQIDIYLLKWLQPASLKVLKFESR